MLRNLNGNGRMNVYWVGIISLKNALVHNNIFKFNFTIEVNDFKF